MKKIYALFLVFFCFFISCDKESEATGNNIETQVSNSTNQLSKNSNYLVGTVDGNNYTIVPDQNIMLDNWNWNLLEYHSIDARLNSLEIFSENGEFYLKATGAEYASTSDLLRIGNNLFSGSISCTSKQCATSKGCVPASDKQSCTACGYGAGDCTKTVTAYGMYEMHLAPSDVY